jgi:hypothetical protein
MITDVVGFKTGVVEVAPIVLLSKSRPKISSFAVRGAFKRA